ncbi:DEKNAAC102277 [Brettanomyces naardenensis]|uniref:DEKNAAC102277 n=1 Tax=Brettanomyces naardenensis TaxID=13370 RepID=A0A448YL80_BRENA|nr:DEKNAAC102277 [Brettanomyces naardenensis]
MSFVEDLWKSVFEPGTNPTLIRATHVSFVMLVLSLSWMIYTTGSIHFINLLIISLLLWASVTWFVSEIQKEKLKSNEELQKEYGEDGKEPKKDI